MHVEIHLLVNQLSLRLMLKFVQIVIHFTLENKVELHVQGVLINSTRNTALNNSETCKNQVEVAKSQPIFVIGNSQNFLLQNLLRGNEKLFGSEVGEKCVIPESAVRPLWKAS